MTFDLEEAQKLCLRLKEATTQNRIDNVEMEIICDPLKEVQINETIQLTLDAAHMLFKAVKYIEKLEKSGARLVSDQ